MSREAISSKQAPAAVGPYSQGVRTDDLLFLSGQLPLDPTTGKIVAGDIRVRARQSLANLDAVAREAGTSLSEAVKVTVFVTDMKDFPAVNEVYVEAFRPPFPARSTVQVAALPMGADVEIEAIVKL